jgi:hypothetical protein
LTRSALPVGNSPEDDPIMRYAILVGACCSRRCTAVRAADSVSGEVVDLACYMAHPSSGAGAGHRKCADTCLKKGMPMAS